MDIVERTRLRILDAGRNIIKKGLVVATWGNISCRIKGKDYIAITPSGMEYDVLKTEDIVILDMEGNIIQGHRRPSTETLLHRHIYKNREDINAIVHTHSTYATALACLHRPIEPIIEELVQVVGGEVKVAEYALPGSKALAYNALVALQDKNAVLLANHGMVGVAGTLKEAFKVCEIVEKGAKITILCNMIGQPVQISPEDVEAIREDYVTNYLKNVYELKETDEK